WSGRPPRRRSRWSPPASGPGASSPSGPGPPPRRRRRPAGRGRTEGGAWRTSAEPPPAYPRRAAAERPWRPGPAGGYSGGTRTVAGAGHEGELVAVDRGGGGRRA